MPSPAKGTDQGGASWWRTERVAFREALYPRAILLATEHGERAIELEMRGIGLLGIAARERENSWNTRPDSRPDGFVSHEDVGFTHRSAEGFRVGGLAHCRQNAPRNATGG